MGGKVIVIKKDGRQQAFDASKISRSAILTANDMGLRMSEREGELIASDVTDRIIRLRGENGRTSSYEIRYLHALVLAEFGYKRVAHSYICESLQ